MVDPYAANRQFERFLGRSLDEPRDDHYMSIEDSSRLRAERRAKDEKVRNQALDDVTTPLCRIVYNLETESMEFFPLE